MEKLYEFLRNQIAHGFFNTRIDNPEDVYDPIVNAINNKKHEVLDPNDVSTPIVEKLQELLEKEVPQEMMISNLKEITNVFVEELSKIETKITVDQKAPTVNVKNDNKELLTSFNKFLDKLDNVWYNKEQIDYTPIMSEMCLLIEQSKMIVDFAPVLDLLDEIAVKNTYIPIEDDRVKVVLSDKQIEILKQDQRIFLPGGVENVAHQRVNPATEETLQAVEVNQDTQIALVTSLNALVEALTLISEDQKQSLYYLKQLPKILEPLQFVDSNYRLFVDVATGNIATVTTLNQLNGQSIYFDQTEVHRTAYNTGVRSNIT